MHSPFCGTIISGHGRGRKLAFPTLNLKVDPQACPAHGVYAVRAHLSNGPQKAVMHVGPRPTFKEHDVSVEVHLLDFSGEVAQDVLEVEVLSFLREVKQFESPEALKKQIQQDVLDAECYF